MTTLNGLNVRTPVDLDWHRSTGLTLTLRAPETDVHIAAAEAFEAGQNVTVVDMRVTGLFRVERCAGNEVVLTLKRQLP